MLECFERYKGLAPPRLGSRYWVSMNNMVVCLSILSTFTASNMVVCLSVLNTFIASNMGVYSAEGAYIPNGCFPTGAENVQTRFTCVLG